MKHYGQQYELVFTDPKKINHYLKLEKIAFTGDVIKSIQEYVDLEREIFGELQKHLFSFVVKFVWLRNKFTYDGWGPMKLGQHRGNIIINQTFALFLQQQVGIHYRSYFSDWRFLNRLARYMDDLFPYFDLGNPFKQPEDYKYPYKHMNLECLYMVALMPERMELLAEGEKRKMTYPVFGDYIVNYISCYNEEHGDTYRLKVFQSSRVGPYVSLIIPASYKKLTKKKYEDKKIETGSGD